MDGTTMSKVAGLPGVFRAPSASADGRYDAYVVAPSPNTEAVVVGTSDGSTSHQIPVFGPAAVGFAPSGPQVAFIAPGEGDRVAPLPLGPVRIVDAIDGRRPGAAREGRRGVLLVARWQDDRDAGHPEHGQPRRRQPSVGHGPRRASPRCARDRRSPATDRGRRRGGRLAAVRRRRHGCRDDARDHLALVAVREPGAAVLRPVRAEPPGVVARRHLDPAAGRDSPTASRRSSRCRRTGRRRASSHRARSASGAPRPSAPGHHRPHQDGDADDHEHERPEEVAQGGQGHARRADREQDQPEHQLPAPAAAAEAAHEGDEQEREAEAEGAHARPGDHAGGGEQVRCGEGRDDRAEVERAEPAVDEPRDEERDADREEQQRAGGLEGGEDLAQEQEGAEDDEEDAEPGQAAAAARAADVVPLPAVDLDPAAVVHLAGDRRVVLVRHLASIRLVDRRLPRDHCRQRLEPMEALRPGHRRVGRRRRRQDEQTGVGQGPRLEAELGSLPERAAIGLLADERHDARRQLRRDPPEPFRAAREVGRAQVARSGRRAQGGVRDADAVPEHLGLPLGAEQLRRQAGRLEQAPEVVARVREVRARGGRGAPGVDPDEDQPQAGREEVGNVRLRHGQPRAQPALL